MNKNTLKDIIKCSILGGIIINLFPNNTFAGHGVAMPGTLQYWGYGGILFNQQENIDISLSSRKGKYVTYLPYNIKNAFGLSPIGDFYRGEKKFIGSSSSPEVGNSTLSRYHYSNYNKTQEGQGMGREWVYGVWEGRGGIYNLYDPKGDKWGECVPYYLSGSNRMNKHHNGNHNSRANSDANSSYTINVLSEIRINTLSRRWESYGDSNEIVAIRNRSWQYHTPRFLGVYAVEELGLQFHIPYVIDEQGIKQKDINLISNAGHLNGMLNPDDVNFDFTFY